MSLRAFVIESKIKSGEWFPRHVMMGTFRDALVKARKVSEDKEHRIRRIESLEKYCWYVHDLGIPFSHERSGKGRIEWVT